MEIKLKLLPPTMPNYAFIKSESKERQEGLSQNSYDIKLFTRQEAEDFGELMKQEFINHWESKQRLITKK